jgi:hypothetical protein
MKIIDKNTFFDIIQTFDFVPFTQSKGWWAYNSTEDENRFAFFVDSLEKPTIACMGHVKNFAWLKMLQIEGECFADEKNIDSKKIKEFYKEITQAGFDMIEVNSSLPYDALYEIGIRQAGYLKPVGLFSTPLSILIDLQKPIEYDKNWQKNLKKAAKYQLEFSHISHVNEKDIEDYILLNKELVSRKQFVGTLSGKALAALLSDEHFELFFVENEEKKRIAGEVTYSRKGISTSIYAANSQEGRKKATAYFRYDKIYKFYKEQNFHFFDCGRISPATHKKNDIFLFKNGVKGDYLLYCGEWSWYKKQIYHPLMYFVKKYLFKRIEV